MHKALLFLACILFLNCNASTPTALSETDKLAATAKIWGFLKYYHPQVAKGKFDWDKQLFETLAKVRKAQTKEELSQVYIDWIDSLGKVKLCSDCAKAADQEYFEKNFDLSWFQSEALFSLELTEKLSFIEQNRHQGRKKYVRYELAKNVKITNENPLEYFDWTSEDERLLCLFRYWNTVEYFFPYKYLTNEPWDEVLERMIGVFLSAKTETELHLAMLQMVVCVDDSHAGFSTTLTRTYFGDMWIPATFKWMDGKAVVTGFYNDSLGKISELRVGDVILSANGKKVADIYEEVKPYLWGSNEPRKKLSAFRSIFNGSTDAVEIEFERNGVQRTVTVKRYPFREFERSIEESEPSKILDQNIGYVNMGMLKFKEVKSVMEELSGTHALIIDVRNYPQGTLFQLAEYFCSEQKVFFKSTKPDLNYPGKFVWEDGYRCGKNQPLKYTGKVFILVNEQTQSHAEFTAMCLQMGDNVVTVGSQTSGADGNVSRLKLVGGLSTAISGLGIYYPDGTETQRVGVKVDVVVKPSLAGLKLGKDEVLEKAVELALK